MAFVTKTWKDRLVEYAGRRKLKNVATGEEILMDVSRSEGTVNQAGDAFSAANMNNLEQRIKTEFDSVNSSLADQPTFEYDETGKITGYKTKVGADTVFPFKNGATYIETLAADFINNNVYLTRGIFDINGIGDQHLITASGNWSGGGYHCYFTISDKATYKSRESGEVADYLYSGIRTICIACM